MDHSQSTVSNQIPIEQSHLKARVLLFDLTFGMEKEDAKIRIYWIVKQILFCFHS